MESGQSDIDVFKEALADDDPEVQMAAINSLPAMALALEEEKTRNLLLPYLLQCITEINDEMQINTAEQLKRFIPLVGGYEHVDLILQILVKMCITDETLVRERAVESINKITEDLDGSRCENLLIPLIHDLSIGEWFTNKCSATSLFSISYAKVSEEAKTDLRHIYVNLTQDEAPMVRKAAATNLVEFLGVLDPEHIKTQFVPVLDNIAKDLQDSVKPLAVDVGLAIARRLDDPEIKDSIFVVMEEFSRDESWKIRYKVASFIHDIQSVLGVDQNRGKILSMFQALSKDAESEVRVAAMKNLFNYCKALEESYKKAEGGNNFEPVIIQSIVPLIVFIFEDPVEDVLLAASSDILSLSTLVSSKCFDEHIFPIVIEALEKHHYIRLKENIIKQLDVLPPEVDLSKHLLSIKKAIHNLVLDSKLHWRTRRSIVLAFVYISKYISKEYFDSKLKSYYFHLLDDPIFAVRRTASMILPLLAEIFGMKWLMLNLLPSFMIWSRHRKYLYRFVALNGISEMIQPSVERGMSFSVYSYLHYFKENTSEKSLRTLAEIVYLSNKLCANLSEEKFKDALSKYSPGDFIEENVKIYAEDTLKVLQKGRTKSVFSLDDDKLKKDDYCYLEGLLIVCIKTFLPVISKLSKDSIQNVQIFSRHTLNKIMIFSETIRNETEESWVKERLQPLTKAQLDDIYSNLEFSMNKVPVGPYYKTACDEVKAEHLVTASDEPLPDLGTEDLDLEINDGVENVNGLTPGSGNNIINDLSKSNSDFKPENMECDPVVGAHPGDLGDFTDAFDSKMATFV